MKYEMINKVGDFASFQSLWSSLPEGGQEGDYAVVAGVVYYWDKFTRNWADSPIDELTVARRTDTFQGDVHIHNDLHVGSDVTIHGHLTVEGLDIHGGSQGGNEEGGSEEGGSQGGGGSYDDTELRQRITNLEKNKQDKLSPGIGITITDDKTIKVNADSVPTPNSKYPVTSGGVYAALASGGGGGGAGGAGGGTQVVVVRDDETETDQPNTLYFFDHSLLQGVGLYNILLRDGSLVGKDGKTYTYNPGTLYHLYEDGSFDVLEDSRDAGQWVDDYKGRARYNWIDENGDERSALTSLPYYGRTLLGNHFLYATTSDTAYTNLRVGGPFYAPVTRVTLHYDSSVVEVAAIKKINVDSSNEQHLSVDTQSLPDGSGLDFSYDGHGNTRRYYDSVQLIIRRRYGSLSELREALTAELRFSNGDDTIVMRVMFGAATVFYKDGVFNPMGLASVNPNLEQDAAGTIVPGKDYLRFKANISIKLAENFTIDQTRYNIMYAKISNKCTNLKQLLLIATRTGWKTLIGPYIGYTDAYYYSWEEDGLQAQGQLPLYGPSPLWVKMQDYHPEGKGDNADFPTDAVIELSRLVIKDWNNYGPFHVSEIGFITHKEPFEE